MEMQVSHPRAPTRRSGRSALKSHIASFVCLVPAGYCGGIVTFGLWNFSDYATAWPQFLRYIAVPGLLGLIFLAYALYGSRTKRIAIGGTGVAILIALFAFEARLEARWVAALEGLIDIPSYQWMVKSGLTGGLPPAKTVTTLNEALHVRSTKDAVLSGIPNETVLLCKSGNDTLTYRADRYGFRNPDSVHDRPVDLMLVGDSFVEGICLPDTKDLVGSVRAIGHNVVGIGTRGAGPLLELAMLERFGPTIRPRQVVLVFYEGNDWENLEHEVNYAWLRDVVSRAPDAGPALMPAATLRAAHQVIDSWVENDAPDTTKLLRNTNLLRNTFALHQTWTQLGLGYPKVPIRMPIYTQILAQARKVTGSWGGKVALLYVPQSSRLVGLIPDYFVYDELRDQVAEAARQNRIQFIDLGAEFLGHRRRAKFYADDGHFTRRGATLAATTLTQALTPAAPGATQ